MNGSQAELKRANLNSAFFKQAYDNHAKVVHVNSFVPSEIVLAMGLVPFNLGAVGGILAQAKAATKLINVAQHHHYSVDLCSTSRCLLGAALQNTLPNPDFLVITSGPCDVGSHIYYILSQMYGRKWFLIDVPAGEADIGDEAVGYLENQLQKLVRVLEETLQIKLDRQCLHQALEFSNQAALYIQKTSSLAQQIPSPLRAEESIELVSCFHLLGCADMAALCGERYEENRRKTLEQPAAKSRKPRILWHGLKPFYTNQIFEHLEKRCQVEVISEIDMVSESPYVWGYLDPERPYRSLARKMLWLVNNYTSVDQHFMQDLSQKMNRYCIDGVIAYNSRGCRHMVGINQVLKESINSQGRPYLEIDGDYIDDRNYSFAQIKTRLDAFAELLYGRISDDDSCRN